MLAPRRVPPWATSPKAISYTRRNPTGPVAIPALEATASPFRPQIGEGEPVAAAGLLNQSGIAEGLENACRIAAHVVADRQDEARGELPERRAGACERRRVGKEAQTGQQTVEAVFRALHIISVRGIRLCNCVGHTTKHAFNIFDRLSVQAATQITLLQNLAAVLGQVDLFWRLNRWREGATLALIIIGSSTVYLRSFISRSSSRCSAPTSSISMYTMAKRM